MTPTYDTKSLREQLADMDDQLGELRAQVEDLREQATVGGNGTMDVEEKAAAMTQAQEMEAIIGELQARRDDIAERLAGA